MWDGGLVGPRGVRHQSHTIRRAPSPAFRPVDLQPQDAAEADGVGATHEPRPRTVEEATAHPMAPRRHPPR